MGAVRRKRPSVTRATTAVEEGGKKISDDDAVVEEAMRAVTRDLAVHEAEYQRFRDRIVAAEGALKNSEFGLAVSLFERVAKEFSPNSYFGELHLGLGCALVGLGRYALAATAFAAAVQHDPCNVNGHLNLGLALVKSGKSREALASFERVRCCCLIVVVHMRERGSCTPSGGGRCL